MISGAKNEISCNPCYNGKGKHRYQVKLVKNTSCNPCYNGKGKHLMTIAALCMMVVILVIMEKVNTYTTTKRYGSTVVILAIMEMVNTGRLWQGVRGCVVILVIMEMVNTKGVYLLIKMSL